MDPSHLTQKSTEARVQSIPTLLVMRAGKVTSRQVGAAPAAALRSWVEQALTA
jgi:thioredoxin 2